MEGSSIVLELTEYSAVLDALPELSKFENFAAPKFVVENFAEMLPFVEESAFELGVAETLLVATAKVVGWHAVGLNAGSGPVDWPVIDAAVAGSG